MILEIAAWSCRHHHSAHCPMRRIRAPEPSQPEYRTENYRAPVSSNARWRAHPNDQRRPRRSGVPRQAYSSMSVLPRAPTKTAESSRGHGLARQATASTSPAASRYLTPATASWRRRPKTICDMGWPMRPGGDKTAALLVIVVARPVAGCRGTPPNELYPTGIANVAWSADGTNGWERAGLPLTNKQPEPRAGEDLPSCTLAGGRFCGRYPIFSDLLLDSAAGRARTGAGRLRSAPRRRSLITPRRMHSNILVSQTS